jgi:dihydrofolate synthase / folylpolyglutamate synthase
MAAMPSSAAAKRTRKTTRRTTVSAKKRTTAAAAPRRRSTVAAATAPGAITSYSSALRWLYEHTDYERMRLVRYNTTTFNLNRMQRLLKALGNPHKDVPFVHIAGTKGKGSTVAMTAAMLQGCGYTVGTFTSPHLVDLRERIQINGHLISQHDLTDLFKLVKTKARAIGEDKPSFFEIMTACAIRHFADQAVDLAVLETGLGGRLDSTNVVKPLLCGLTQISLDHTNVLGKTLGAIAAEKAGIMKKGVPCLTCEQPAEVMEVFRKTAEEVGAPLLVVGKDIEFSYRFEANRELGPHTRICLSTPHGMYEHLAVPLKGEHQALNCGLALALVDRLIDRGFQVPEEKLIQGLGATKLPGRMELAWTEPRILLDGAHNAASLHALVRSIGAHVPYDSLVMIFGCCEDKDIFGMLQQLSLGADKVIFTRARNNPRAMDPDDLLRRFSDVTGKMAQTAPSLEAALNLAARAVGREDLICVTGSFYLVGETKKYLHDLAAKRARQTA